MRTEDYNRDIFDIDKNSLDEAWLGQAKLFLHYSELLADAKASVDRLRAQVDVREAELNQKVLATPKKYTNGKTTAPVIKAAVVLLLAKEKVVVKLRKAKHKADLCQAWVNALEHRKRALENLVSLFGKDYFANPIPKDEESKEFIQSEREKNTFNKRKRR